MKLYTRTGNYAVVPKRDILVAFWATTDMAITHGDASICVDNYYGTYHDLKKKIGNDRGKETWVGKVMPYVYSNPFDSRGHEQYKGQKIAAMFSHVNFFEQASEENIVKCLQELRRIMLAGKIQLVSMPYSRLGMDATIGHVQRVFDDTDLQVALQTPF